MQTESLRASDWWARPRDAQAAAHWIANYQKSLDARHRGLIAAAVAELGAASVFEVGCHCGPNLVRLAEANRQLVAMGIDVSAEAIAAGRAWVQHLALSDRIRLETARFPDGTARMESRSADVVLSCYTLAYLAPPDLDAALYEMGRLAARAVILAEPMALEGKPTGMHQLSGYREWAHDYQAALPWIGSLHGAEARVIPVTPPVDRLNAILVITR